MIRKMKRCARASYGYEIPFPSSLKNIKVLSKLGDILGKYESGYFFTSDISNGTAKFGLYTNDENIVKEIDECEFE